MKIRDKERNEPPHASVLHRSRTWRWSLRGQRFLDRDPSQREVPDEVVDELRRQLRALVDEWNAAYPHNRV